MSQINRREFIGTAAIAAGALAVGAVSAEADQNTPRKITDRIKLGKTNLRVSVVGVGTGTIGSGHQSNQTRLGQEAFTAMIRHAYDNGINFFDCADQYGSHSYLREALKSIPRNKYVIQTKSNSHTADGIRADLDRFRKELGVDCIDIVLMHCMMDPNWTTNLQPVKDVLEEARSKGTIKAHGCSCHTFEALQAAAADSWVQVDLARFNPWSKIMDSRPEAVKPVLESMNKAGKGVIAMKILAEGQMVRGDDRLKNARESIKHALASGVVHSMVIGFESPAQVTEILNETKVAMEEIKASREA